MTVVAPAQRRINILQGEFAVSSDADCVITTLLGSCVAVCLHDPLLMIGGMNHILLPGDSSQGDSGASGRLGVHLMELLINGLLKLGANRDRLQAKLFGGARTVKGLSDIGKRNVEFSRNFLSREGISILPGSTGGEQGRKLQFTPCNGKVRLQFMAHVSDPAPILPQSLLRAGQHGEVELFGDN